jgi:HAD superfamily hydrolase (TIGR01509 family)
MALVRGIYMNCELVIFDCDGVLVDSEPTMNQLLTDALVLEGLNLTNEETRVHFKGLNNSDSFAKANQLLGRELPDDFMVSQDEVALEVLKSDLRPDVAQIAVIEQILESGIPMCVASNGRRHIVSAKLDAVGLLTLFGDRIYTAEDVARGKPFPDIFLLACSELGAEPSRSLVIEDSQAGLDGAQAANTMTVHFGPLGAIDAPSERHFGSIQIFGQLLPILGIN